MNTPPGNADAQPRIVVVGSINLDLVVKCDRLPQPGETLTAQSFDEIPGGKGANQAVAAARLGASVAMIGRLGNDAFGRTLRQGLIAAGVEVTHVLDTSDCESGVALITVDDRGENTIAVVGGANARLTPADVEASEPAFRGAKVLLLQLETPLAAILSAVRLARRHGLKVIVDPAPAVDSLPAELLAADVLCPNETEASRLCGYPVDNSQQARRAAEWLRDQGAAVAIVKRGEHGVVVSAQENAQNKPCREFASYRVNAIDATGAGDAFAAALGVALAEATPLGDAIPFACAAGAVAASRAGALPAMPTRDDVMRLMASQSPTVSNLET
ncbi:MAG: ribokinase [Pirellulales bacterium]